MIAYGILGGIPRYLNAFTDSKSIKDNIAEEILRNGAFLNDEPEILLRTELREPAVYNSILEAVPAVAIPPVELPTASMKTDQKSESIFQLCKQYAFWNDGFPAVNQKEVEGRFTRFLTTSIAFGTAMFSLTKAIMKCWVSTIQQMKLCRIFQIIWDRF